MPDPASRLSRPLIAAVSDGRRLHPHRDQRIEQLVAWAATVARAGVDVIQLRERDLEGGRLTALVRRVVAATQGSGVRVIVNERTDVALAAGAHGVHLPSSAPSASRIRQLVPRHFLVGRSVHSADEAVAVEQDGGCDYLLFGTVFPSASKPADHQAAGVAALQQVVRAVQLPVVAIGGITPALAGDVAETGAAGIAAISVFVDSRGGPADDATLLRVVTALREPFRAEPGCQL